MIYEQLPPWEALLKRIVFTHLGDVQHLRVLDFGSGNGVTADHLAAHNRVLAIEPNEDAVRERFRTHEYEQRIGSLDVLESLHDESFDLILCHNVLEYVPERAEVVRAFHRLLRPGGQLSIVKHNRDGRVMQMAVLLNRFDDANALLDGADSHSARFGTIRYYEDEDVCRWCPELHLQRVRGIRCFWDLQQEQDIQRDPDWQAQMTAMELRVSELEPYRAIAFFHHLTLTKPCADTSAASPNPIPSSHTRYKRY